MKYSELKDLFIFIIIISINIAVTLFITSFFKISNIVIWKTHSVIYGDITTDVLIYFVLTLICAYIYDSYKKCSIKKVRI